MIISEIICAQGIKMVLSKFFTLKNTKYKVEIFESSDFAHIHRDE